jgi:hypothetical protein
MLTASQIAVLNGVISRLQELVNIKRDSVRDLLQVYTVGGHDAEAARVLAETESIEIAHIVTTITELRNLRGN